MSGKTHTYTCTMTWTGNTGQGTATYASYTRNHVYAAPGKPDVPGSAEPDFRGDAGRYNPEELLVASLSGCHMLWYLHLCADAGVVVTAYVDEPRGTIADADKGKGFTQVILRPRVTIAKGGNVEAAHALHAKAHAKCNIANSVNFPVTCEPDVIVAG